MSTVFTPCFEAVASFEGTEKAEELFAQTGMYAADWDFAWNHSGQVVRNMLSAIPDWYHQHAKEQNKELNIDIRVHEMKVGDYPASPGWHVDAAQRETAFQHDAERTDVEYSLVGTVSSHPNGVSNTIFASQPITVEGSYEELTAQNNLLLQERLDESQLHPVPTTDGKWVLFDPYSIHNVEATKNDGVRLFIRVSIWERPENHVPGITRTEQVYSVKPLTAFLP